MVTRKLIRITSPEAAALAAKETSAAEDSTTVNKQPTTLLPNGKDNKNVGSTKRPLPSEDALLSGEETASKRRRADGFAMDLTDVPHQLPILKSEGRQKEGSSKYTGVSFSKASNKWQARIRLEGKLRYIGYYENEEEAAIDYARAVFKYNGQGALDKARKMSGFAIDLSDVPTQLPIPKNKLHCKEETSRYVGVSFEESMNKWKAKIMIDGNQHHIGLYENEEEAAIDYARALFKYKGQEALDKARKRSSVPTIGLRDIPPQESKGRLKEGGRNKSANGNKNETVGGKKRALSSVEALSSGRNAKKRQRDDRFVLDLSDAPPQLPILKSEGNIKGGTSKYVGVNFDKKRKIWKAIISIKGKLRHIGYYKNEEEAAIDFARAVFKFKGQDAVDKARERKSPAISIDLSHVPQQPLILKSIEGIKEGSSKYLGVYFDKTAKKWSAKIVVDGMLRHIGWYKNEEEAAADYARAVFKYKGPNSVDKAKERKMSTLR